jgi:hypothetical protein
VPAIGMFRRRRRRGRAVAWPNPGPTSVHKVPANHAFANGLVSGRTKKPVQESASRIVRAGGSDRGRAWRRVPAPCFRLSGCQSRL